MKILPKIQRVRLGDAKKLTRIGFGAVMELNSPIAEFPSA